MRSFHRLRAAWYALVSSFPKVLRDPLRKASATSLGYLESISICRDEMVPPLRIRFHAGFGNWAKVGMEFLDIFVEFGGLEPGDSVLEAGCGFGRIAVPLTKYLDNHGKYEGFDVVPEAVSWCQTRISPRYPNFRFRLVDIRNGVYNPSGSVDPADFKFPYPAGSFSFVYLTSVFTHLMPSAVQNYVREIARVLAKGGRCAITGFLLDERSIRLMKSGKSELDFPADFRSHRIQDPTRPERAIAYDAKFIVDLFEESGLNLVEPILWGSWSGRESFVSVQDIVVTERE